MAGLPLPAVGALAVEVIEQVQAAPPVLTRVVFAFVHIWRERQDEWVSGRRAMGATGAGPLTEVAEPPLPALGADALEGDQPVDAGPSVPAGGADAVVDVCQRAEGVFTPGYYSNSGPPPPPLKLKPTFVAVDAAEARLAHAGEVSAGPAEAAAPRAAHVGRDAPHSGRVVGRHGDGAAVDGCETRKARGHRFGGRPRFKLGGRAELTLAGGGPAALPEPLARLSLVAFGTRAVEVGRHAVARGGVLAGVGLAGVRPARDLEGEEDADSRGQRRRDGAETSGPRSRHGGHGDTGEPWARWR